MKKIIASLGILTLLGACVVPAPRGAASGVSVSSNVESHSAMANADVVPIDRRVPFAVRDLQEQEALAFRTGRPLNKVETQIARAVGVQNPERVRIAIVERIPISENSGISSEQVLGLTARYGVFLREDITRVRGVYLEVLAHELAHVAQFEQVGIKNMAIRYFQERDRYGRNAIIPIEREAVEIGLRVYDDPRIEYGV